MTIMVDRGGGEADERWRIAGEELRRMVPEVFPLVLISIEAAACASSMIGRKIRETYVIG